MAADQVSKWWIRTVPGQHPVFEAGIFRILYVENTGAAFGLLPNQFILLTITAISGILLILSFAFYFSRHFSFINTRACSIALGLILGGTIGNLIDRLRFGFVTDFISVGFWPVFNIADSAVTIGIILFAYLFLVSPGPGVHLGQKYPDKTP